MKETSSTVAEGRRVAAGWGGAPGGVTKGTGDGVMGEGHTGTVVRVFTGIRTCIPKSKLSKVHPKYIRFTICQLYFDKAV